MTNFLLHIDRKGEHRVETFKSKQDVAWMCLYYLMGWSLVHQGIALGKGTLHKYTMLQEYHDKYLSDTITCTILHSETHEPMRLWITQSP